MKTKLQIYKLASEAAEESLGLNTEFEVESVAIERFTAANGDKLDWPFYRETFNDLRATFMRLGNTKSTSQWEADLASKQAV